VGSTAPGEATLHALVDGFDVFGVQIQYWMPLIVLLVAAAVAIGKFTAR
jgi:hypothetical protein